MWTGILMRSKGIEGIQGMASLVNPHCIMVDVETFGAKIKVGLSLIFDHRIIE